MLGIGYFAFSQKQQTDARTFEVNFSPFGGSPISINGIKVRKFSDDYNAIRLEVFLGLESDKSVSLQEGENGIEENPNPLTYSRSRGFDISIRPGIEKHFDGTSRLSPYVGVVADLGFSSSSNTEEYWSAAQLMPTEMFSSHAEWEQKTSNGSIRLGLNAVAGMDFYFADNIYLGAEFGFGLGFTSSSDTKYESTDDNAWAVASTTMEFGDVNFGNGEITVGDSGEIEEVMTREDEENGSQFNLGPNVNGAIRLGFIF